MVVVGILLLLAIFVGWPAYVGYRIGKMHDRYLFEALGAEGRLRPGEGVHGEIKTKWRVGLAVCMAIPLWGWIAGLLIGMGSVSSLRRRAGYQAQSWTRVGLGHSNGDDPGPGTTATGSGYRQ